MRLADLRVGEVGALAELLCRHLGLYLGGLDEVGLQLLRMLEGEVAGALVDPQPPPDGFRILLRQRQIGRGSGGGRGGEYVLILGGHGSLKKKKTQRQNT